MKSYFNFNDNFEKLNKREEVSTSSKIFPEVNNKGVKNEKPKSVFLPLYKPLSLPGGEGVLNKITYPKDVAILKNYGGPLESFFFGGSSLMLPMFTSFPDPRGVKRVCHDYDISIDEGMSTTLYIRPFSNILVVKQENTNQTMLVGNADTSCFISYKVVCCKISIKQVGIMEMSDGYGTIMDAVVVGPNTPVSFLKDNLLSIQCGPGKSLKMIDGRLGLTSFFLGSPFFESLPIGALDAPVSRMVGTNSTSTNFCYIPPYCAVSGIRGPEGDATLVAYFDDGTNGPLNPSVTYFNKAITGISGRGVVLYEEPQGDSLFVRISPPSVAVSYKMYIEVVVEGPVKPEYLTNMPQIAPPFCFDFARLKYAFENCYPSLRVGGPKPVGYAMNQNKIQVEYPYKKKGNAVFKEVNNLPKFLKEATEVLGLPPTTLYSPPSSARLFRDGVEELPEVSYQYFPVLGGEGEAEAALVAVFKGKEGDSCYTISIPGADEKMIEKNIFYSVDDFESEEEFIGVLETVIKYVYTARYHKVDPDDITIRIFSTYKIKDVSYMYALTLAMFGAYSGGFYTGSYKEVNGVFVPNEMEENVIKAKVGLAEAVSPLIVLYTGKMEGAATLLMSGFFLDFFEGKAMLANDVDKAIEIGFLPFSLRLTKSTPYHNLIAANKEYLSTKVKRPYKTFIAAQNVKNEGVLTSISEGKFPTRTFARCDVNKFSCFITHKKKYITADEFYNLYPDYLNNPEVWKYEYKNTLFVDKNLFKSHLRDSGYRPVEDYSPDIASKLEALNRGVLNVSEKEAGDELKEALRSLNPVLNSKIKIGKEVFKPPQQEGQKEKIMKDMQDWAKQFYLNILQLEKLIKDNAGGTKLTKHPTVGQSLLLLELPATVQKEAVDKILQSQPYKHISDAAIQLGTAGPAVIALAAGKRFRAQVPNPSLQQLKQVSKYLQNYIARNGVPPEDEELAMEDIKMEIDKKEKKKPQINIKNKAKKFVRPIVKRNQQQEEEEYEISVEEKMAGKWGDELDDYLKDEE